MRDAGFHDQFAAMLRGGEVQTVARFTGGNLTGLPVYRNSVVRAAIDVLGDNYPAVRAMSGDGNFAALAKAYWTAHPPRDGVMARYGSGFADFMTVHAPPGMPSILPDIARLDRAWSEAHLAANAATLSPGDLAGIDPDRLAARSLRLHPSVRLPLFRRAVHACWAAARFEGRMIPAGPVADETVLVWRPHHEVRHRTLEPVEAALLNQLAAGAALALAAERAACGIETFIRLLNDGVFARD
ncbi:MULTISPECIES: DNA-binding domain-containing protein [Hyphobacterium]|uniref:DNA-binding domain-containing protein n=1 Tax=Hyphobacterium vulgare TaxID=1736751 RepID=A0ABV6ZVU4_9PROT